MPTFPDNSGFPRETSPNSVVAPPRAPQMRGPTPVAASQKDVFELSDSLTARRERGVHVPPRSTRQQVKDFLGWGFGRPVRLVGQTLASVLPLSVLTDTMVYPSWSCDVDERCLTRARDRLAQRFEGERVKIPIQGYALGTVPTCGSSEKLDGMYFQAKGPLTDKTVLFCNPNAGFYETCGDVVDFYRNQLGCNVLLFNYRGAGASESRPTTDRTLHDMEDIYDWLVTHKEIQEKDLLVHGRSVGGVHAASLASAHPRITLVCDRTFENLASAANGMYGGGVGGALFSGLAYTFSSNELSTHQLYQQVKGNKVCVADHNDEMFENYRGEGGDLIELNSTTRYSHNRLELTLGCPLFKKWVTQKFLVT